MKHTPLSAAKAIRAAQQAEAILKTVCKWEE